MESVMEENGQTLASNSAQAAQRSVKTRGEDYQDTTETRDSKFKAIWDGEMGDIKNNYISYRKAFVLLLSWHDNLDDLHTKEEVAALDTLFQEKFQYQTVRKTLDKDPRRTAQAQVNRHLAEFVYDHDDTNTLLIVYYAGHGRPGESRGSLKLTGSTSLKQGFDSELHEVVWSSAEHNIKDTRADVLVIFDCCHAGELERNVRGTFTQRAFEFLAATSAGSTTKKPSKESFTSALLWSLSDLVDKHESFSTQELLRTILHDAPHFPRTQVPRLSERMPSSLRKIMLAPLTRPSSSKAVDISEVDDDEDITEETRQDLLIRFVFNTEITDLTIKEIARHLGRLIKEREIKAKALLWEGINLPGSFQMKDSVVTQKAIQKFLNILDSKRKKILGASPTEETPRSGLPKTASTGVRKAVAPSSPPSVDESDVATPDPGRSTTKPEIGEDQGASHVKPMTKDAFHEGISLIPGSGLRGRLTRLRNTTPKNRKRSHSANDRRGSVNATKRSKRDTNEKSAND